MSDGFAEEIINDLSDDRTIEERKAIAEVTVARVNRDSVESNREYNQEFVETDQENYLKESSRRDTEEATMKTTVIRESEGGVYVLEESMEGNEYRAEVHTSEQAIYANSIDDKEDFKRLEDSLAEGNDIQLEKRLDGKYVASGGV